MSRFLSDDNGWLAYYARWVGAWVRRTGEMQNAEDAAQNAVLGMLEGDAACIEDPRAYLRRSSRNSLVDMHRQRIVHNAVPLHELAEAEHPRAEGPESVLQASELAEALMTALSQLPLKCQQVYVYHRLEGWTHTEIAQKMGLSRSMVEKYMTRALRHIHEQLHDYAPY